MTTVSGIIRDTQKAPLAALTVTLRRLGPVVGFDGGAIGPDTKTFTTGGNGLLTMPDLATGRYEFDLAVPANPQTSQTVLRRTIGIVPTDAGDTMTLEQFLTESIDNITPTLVQQATAAAAAAEASAIASAASEANSAASEANAAASASTASTQAGISTTKAEEAAADRSAAEQASIDAAANAAALPAIVAALSTLFAATGQAAGQVNGGRVRLTGGSMADPALLIGKVGIYSAAENTLSVAIGGTERLRVSTDGITVYGTITQA